MKVERVNSGKKKKRYYVGCVKKKKRHEKDYENTEKKIM